MRAKALLFLFLFTIASTTMVLAISSVNVPLDNWAYSALEKLDGFGLLHSDLQGLRPFTRMEVARLVQEALVARDRLSEPLPELANYFLERFKKEYKDELSFYDPSTGTPAKTYIKPLEEAQARYVYSEGEPRSFVNIRKGVGQLPKSNYGVIANEGTPLVYNNDGVVYGEHNNFSLQFSSSFRFMNFFSGYMEPLLVVRQNEGDLSNFDAINLQALPGELGQFDQVDIDLLKAYGKVSVWNVEIEAGRDSMWWGNGRHGDFILTNNATPFDMLKLSNPTPSLLPWYFSYLGPIKYTLFASQLEDDRFVPHPLLMGLRIDFKPHPLVEIGFNTTFLSGGKDQPTLTFGDYLAAFTGFNFGQSGGKIDQLTALDIRVQLPFLRNTEIYGEYAGEDSGGTEFAEEWFGLGDVGYLVGIYVPRLTDDGKSDLRLEFARNAHRVDSNPGFWYGNGQYRSGYTYEGMFPGHHMGGDALDFFVRTTRYLRNDLVVGLDYDYMARGLTLGRTEETVNQFGTDITYEFWRNLSVQARYGFESVDNWNLVSGEDRQNHLVMTGIKLDF